MGKICDEFVVDGRRLCGPSLLVPGMGKCGTNAIRSYTALHPSIKWSTDSEIDFDPRETDPVDLIRRHSPGVTPHDPFVWALKHPACGDKDGLQLGLALKKAFPSARVLLAACDPTFHPFRWFRHYVTKTLFWKDPQHPSTCSKTFGGNGLPCAKFDELQHYLVRHNLASTVGDIFKATFPVEGGCEQSSQALAMLEGVGRTFDVGADWFGGSWCTRVQQSGELRLSAEDIRRWLQAGYTLHTDEQDGTLAVIFMENWTDGGRTYIARIARMLQLPLDDFPWERTNGFRPVYSVLGSTEAYALHAAALDVMLTTPDLTKQAASECGPLATLLGERPPWPACHAVFDEPSPPIASPPALPLPTPPLPTSPPLPQSSPLPHSPVPSPPLPQSPPLPHSPVPSLPPSPSAPLSPPPAWVTTMAGLAWKLPCRVPCGIAPDRATFGLQEPCQAPCPVIVFALAALIVALASIVLLHKCTRALLRRLALWRGPELVKRGRKKSSPRRGRKKRTYACVGKEDDVCTNGASQGRGGAPTRSAISVLSVTSSELDRVVSIL